ncbi:MAG: hypothetical protein HYS08_04900 [Chlamydiae bacterium]|nr:hypothetical protein [Chlamydiota bacterium]MBI3267089.1 hypothetical protein [Chlamydiota bacterium]
MKHSLQIQRGEKGTTVLEVLSSVTIVLTLASLLLSSITGAREKSHKALCINNLKHLTAAFIMFANDSQEFPSEIAFRERPFEEPNFGLAFASVSDYYDNEYVITRCPNVQGSITDSTPVYSYGLNQLIRGVNLSRVQKASEIVLVAESDDKEAISTVEDVAYRHAGIAFAGFADGHVAKVEPMSLENSPENYYGSVEIPPSSQEPVDPDSNSNSTWNNGVGNGEEDPSGDPNNSGNPPTENDGAGTSPGSPGNQGGTPSEVVGKGVLYKGGQ